MPRWPARPDPALAARVRGQCAAHRAEQLSARAGVRIPPTEVSGCDCPLEIACRTARRRAGLPVPDAVDSRGTRPDLRGPHVPGSLFTLEGYRA